MVADRCWCAAKGCEVATPSPALPTRGREIYIAGLPGRGREICTPSPALPTRGRENVATRGRERYTPSPALPTRGRENVATRGRERYTPSPPLPAGGREGCEVGSGGLFAGTADRAPGLDSRNRGPTGGDQRVDAGVRAGLREAAADDA